MTFRRPTARDTRTDWPARLSEVPLLAWLLTQSWAAERLQDVRRTGDRGDALVWVALSLAGIALVGLVLVGLRDKGTTLVNNICTNADPTTC